MKTIKRRTFIKSFLSSTALLSIISKSTNAHSDTNNHAIYSAINDELIRTNIAWKKKYIQTPSEYLNSININGTREASYQCRTDFKSGNTLEIEGLVLSKTETALMLEFYFG